MTDITPGSRVSYTVMYGTKPDTRYITEYGRVTRMWPPGAPAMASIAVENPQPGRAKYVTRKLRDIELAPDAVAEALAAVDAVKPADLAFLSTVARDYGPDSTPAANLRELLALRKLADAVRSS